MVATVDELIQIVRSNPFIDGIGYFIEATTCRPVPPVELQQLNDQLQARFCHHAQISLEEEKVLGIDFHEHICTQGPEGQADVQALHAVLKGIESRFGLDHLCVELQFDLASAKKANHQLDELLQP